MIKQNQIIFNRLIVFLDSLSIVLALLFSWYIRFKTGIFEIEGGYIPYYDYIRISLIVIPIYLLIYNFFKMYTAYRIKNIFDEFLNIFISNVFGILIFTLILYLTKEIDYSRYLLFIFVIINISFTTIERMIIRSILGIMRKKGYNIKHMIFIGYSDLTEEFLYKIYKNKKWGYKVKGYFDDNINEVYYKDMIAATKESASESINYLGSIDDLDYYLNNNIIDEVYVTLSLDEYSKLAKVIDVCEKNGIKTQIIPDYFRYIPARPFVEEVEGLPIINTRYIPLENLLNKIIKRLFDICIATLAIAIFMPIMIVIAISIKLSSKGSIIYKQERVGYNRKKFTMYKFRSMTIEDKTYEQNKWTTKDDNRITRLGRFIRSTSIDELPQLFNVLLGNMSIIGPRPERDYFVNKFKDEIPKYMVKHQVRPGITGLAQINGYRGDTSINKRIEFDIYYIENWSFILDIKIVILTVFKGFVHKNAY